MAAAATNSNLTEIIYLFVDIVKSVIPFLGALAFLVFVWGIAKFIKSAGNEKESKDSKNMIVWGIVGLFVMIMIWGIISFLRNEAGFGGGAFGVPQVHFPEQ
jgi:hypothetical protein